MQELAIQQINESILGAVEKTIPLGLTIERGGWASCHSRFIAIRDEHILVELPTTADGTPQEFSPAEKVAMSFKLKHHKYLCAARVAGQAPFALDDGTSVPVLALCFPTSMQRLQRRSFARVVVPRGKIVRVSFWAGGRDQEPIGPSDKRMVWSGQVLDLSAGGFRASLAGGEPNLEIGQTVGVRLAFGPGEETLYCDAVYRHHDATDGGTSLGFQFIGLAHSDQGRAALRTLSHKMSDFTRFGSNQR